jgi:hypothetical protein
MPGQEGLAKGLEGGRTMPRVRQKGSRTWPLGLLLIFAAIFAVTSVVRSANAGTQTFGAVADAYVSAANRTSNFGTGPRIEVDANPVMRGFRT